MTELLSPQESSRFVDVLESLNRVSHRHELIEWAHASLSRIVEFSSMVCLLAEPHGRSFRVRDVIASNAVTNCLDATGKTEHHALSVSGAERVDAMTWTDGIADASSTLIDRWMRSRTPMQVEAAFDSSDDDQAALGSLMACFDDEAVTMHGVKEAFSGSTTFVMLGTRSLDRSNRAQLEILELVMPSLHLARQRIYRHERSRGDHQSTIGLTPREIKILTMIAEGRTDEEAARLTGRSVHTIKNQVRHVVAKLGARNRTQAALLAVHHGLLRL